MTIPLTQYWAVLAPHLRWQWRRMTLLALLLVATTTLQLLSPQLLRLFLDTALAGGTDGGALAEAERAHILGTTALLFLVSGLATQALSAAATFVGNDVGWLATNRLRADLALHCLRLDMAFHNARTPGELIERTDGDVNAMANFFSAFVVRVLGSVLLMAGVLVALAREDSRAGLLLALFAIVTVVVLTRSRGIAVLASAAEREASARLFGFLEERLAGMDDLRANGAGGYVMRRFHERLADLFHRGRTAWMRRALIWAITIGLFGLGNALAMALGARLVELGAITIGTAFLFFRYVELLLNPLERLTDELQDLQRASAGLGRIQALYAERPTILDGRGASLPPGPLTVELAGVSFRYPDAVEEDDRPGPPAEPVLTEVSFRLEPGRVLGLLGRTGSGKTTIARLLFRLYDPTAGSIRLAGVDLRSLRLAQLRARVTMVTQDVQLFHGTVRENVTLFDEGIADARLLEVLDELGLMTWYETLPRGLDTLLGHGGHGLSAGESQLLAFTRAFLGQPSLVILDEASSRLDPATEQLIERAVDRLLRGRTGVVIAHRLATIQRADDILILEGGRIREHGRRTDLAGEPASRFAALLRAGGQGDHEASRAVELLA